MGQVTVTLNERNYRLECNEGEEEHLIELAEYIGAHVDDMRRKFGQVGDDRLILMASLVLTDQLWELRREIEELNSQLAEARRNISGTQEQAKTVEAELSTKIGEAALRLEGLNARLTQSGDQG